MRDRVLFGLLAAALVSSVASADIVGFVETFNADSANWRNFNGTANLEWVSAGGPDGSGFARSMFNLSGTSVGGFPPTVIRAQSNFGSSGGAYVGDWIAAGVTGVSFDFRHNLDADVVVAGRFAVPLNNFGASVVSSVAVASNTWTTITIDLTPTSADFISFGGSDYNTIFSNIGNMQIGFNVPAALAGQNIDGLFDIDNFRVVPSPSAALVVGLGVAGFRRRR